MSWLQEFIHAPEDGQEEESKAEKSNGRVLLFEPKEFNDISQAADQLIAGRIIVINLHRMAQDQKQRIVDFINGVVYSHQGRITKGGRDLILCSPGRNEMIGDSFAAEPAENTAQTAE